MQRDNQAFFTVMNNSDLWKEFKKYMYPGKKTGNWYTWNASGDVAASNGYLSLIKDRETSMGFTANAMDFAAMKGHLEIVKWLHLNRTEGCSGGAMVQASAHRHPEVVEWLKQNIDMFKD